jgi:hypothetical protein
LCCAFFTEESLKEVENEVDQASFMRSFNMDRSATIQSAIFVAGVASMEMYTLRQNDYTQSLKPAYKLSRMKACRLSKALTKAQHWMRPSAPPALRLPRRLDLQSSYTSGRRKYVTRKRNAPDRKDAMAATSRRRAWHEPPVSHTLGQHEFLHGVAAMVDSGHGI